MISSQDDFNLQKFLVSAFVIQAFFDHSQVLLLDAEDTGVSCCAADLLARALLLLCLLLLRFEEDVFADGPAEIEDLTDLFAGISGTGQAASTKEDDVEGVLIEIGAVESLAFVEIYYRTELKDEFDCVYGQLAEDWMEALKADVADVHLHFLIFFVCFRDELAICCPHSNIILVELLPNLKESLLYFLLDFRLELLLHVLQFQILTFEVLQGMHFL